MKCLVVHFSIIFTLISISMPHISQASNARTTAVKAKKELKFKDSKKVRNAFNNNLKIGMSKEDVLKIMGSPTKIEGEVWSYFENRAPKAGEHLYEYQIVF